MSEAWRGEDETWHEVTLTRAFWIGLYEVSEAEFYDRTGYNPSTWGCGRCPVTEANWHEAAAFANAVSDRAGLERCFTCVGSGPGVVCELATATPYDCAGYRLPTEAEWENSARAGTRSAFSNGGNLVEGTEDQCGVTVRLTNGESLGDIAVYCGNSAGHPEHGGSREANPWGLYDVHGNAWEWCHDWNGEYDDEAEDPWGPVSGVFRVSRGGSWQSRPSDARVANRNKNDPAGRHVLFGFRLARTR